MEHQPTTLLLAGIKAALLERGYEIRGVDDMTPPDRLSFYVHDNDEAWPDDRWFSIGTWRNAAVRDGGGPIVRLSQDSGDYYVWVSAIPEVIARLIVR